MTALDAIFAQLVPDGIDEVYDRISDVLRNDAPVIEHFTGDGGVGPFPIEIRGFGGLFFVEAQEFDPDGVFDSLEDARDCLHFNYDPFIDNYKNLSK